MIFSLICFDISKTIPRWHRFFFKRSIESMGVVTEYDGHEPIILSNYPKLKLLPQHHTYFSHTHTPPSSCFSNSHLKVRHFNEKCSPERGRIPAPSENWSPGERGRIPSENRSPHHVDDKLIQDRKSFPTHSYLPELESKSLDYIEPRTKRLSPPARSANKPGPQVKYCSLNSL